MIRRESDRKEDKENLKIVNIKDRRIRFVESKQEIFCCCTSPRAGHDGGHSFSQLGMDVCGRLVFECNDCFTLHIIKKSKAEKRRYHRLKKKENSKKEL